LIRDPNKWGEDEVVEEAVEVPKGVMGMKFMRDAEERQKRENERETAELRAMFEDGTDEDGIVESTTPAQDNINLGRKKFVPGDESEDKKKSNKGHDNSIAEGEDESGEEDGERIELRIVKNPFHMHSVCQGCLFLTVEFNRKL
jgi:U3 small nucleolar RNA-associated protein 14